jgi:two-component sensor histidine kinase
MGGSLVIPQMLALPLTLIVHELSTNSAKYGALSSPSARININWSVDDARGQMIWTESGGPAVHSPNHKGFGSELFARALAPFHGKVEPEFAPDGFKCRITFALPSSDRAAFGVERKMITTLLGSGSVLGG